MIVKPLRDMVLVKPVAGPLQTEGGIYIPETADEHERKGEVIAVGPGRIFDNGTVKPMSVKAGDRVAFWLNRPATEVTVAGEKLHLLNEGEILAVLQQEAGDPYGTR